MLNVIKYIVIVFFSSILFSCSAIKFSSNNSCKSTLYQVTYSDYKVKMYLIYCNDCEFRIKVYNDLGIKILEMKIEDTIEIIYQIEDLHLNQYILPNNDNFSEACNMFDGLINGFAFDNQEILRRSFKRIYNIPNNSFFLIESENFKIKGKKVILNDFDIIYKNRIIRINKIK